MKKWLILAAAFLVGCGGGGGGGGSADNSVVELPSYGTGYTAKLTGAGLDTLLSLRAGNTVWGAYGAKGADGVVSWKGAFMGSGTDNGAQWDGTASFSNGTAKGAYLSDVAQSLTVSEEAIIGGTLKIPDATGAITDVQVSGFDGVGAPQALSMFNRDNSGRFKTYTLQDEFSGYEMSFQISGELGIIYAANNPSGCLADGKIYETTGYKYFLVTLNFKSGGNCAHPNSTMTGVAAVVYDDSVEGRLLIFGANTTTQPYYGMMLYQR